MKNRIKAARHVAGGFNRLAFFSGIALVLLTLSGCGDTQGTAANNETEAFTSGGSLYVANGGNGRLLMFDPPAVSAKPAQSKPIPRVDEGNVFPDRQFPDALSGPAGIFFDRVNDTLYVANPGQNAIQIYDNASTLTAPLSASRVISGSSTLLDQPFAVTFDAVTNRLFVANREGNTITAYSGASLSGNIVPSNLLVGEQTQLDFPRGLAVDAQRDLLYISNSGSDAILVYDNANAIGASPSSCGTDFTSCNKAPSRVILPHTGTENVSKLELPFGIHIDSANNRLYVANTGLNTPAILIYENASTRDGAEIPERVITGLNTQLTTPAGIDVDAARGRVMVINNNSPNNVNASNENNSGAVVPGGRTECSTANPCPTVNPSGGDNVDSPSLVVFNGVDTACTAAASPCNLAPSLRVGGDVSTEVGTTLSSPLGVAFDPDRDTTYVANTGANNIFVYAVGGNTAPLKENAGNATELNVPSGFFYDLALDRLYISNASDGTIPSPAPITVYNHVSDQSFKEPKAPNWKISDPSFQLPRGMYIDKTHGLMLVADGSNVPPQFPPQRHGLIAYNLKQNFFLGGVTQVPFPLNDADGPAGSATATVDLQPPPAPKRTTDGLSAGGPSALSVDEARGEVYVTDKNNNSVVVFKLPPPAVGAWLKDREITGLKSPSGVFIDTQRDILYVTNNGVETGVSKDNAVLVFDNASTKGDGLLGCPTPCLPDRIISTENFTDENKKLKAPISPFVDLSTDRLYLIKSAEHVVGTTTHPEAVLTLEDASTLGDAGAGCVNGTGTCADIDSNKVKILSGDKTRLEFWQNAATTPLRRYTGAVFLSRHNNNETLYVGQSLQKGCTSLCSFGALLVYGIEGKVPPGKIWTGGSGGFTAPEAIAIDSQSKMLYVANQTSNTLSILTNADKVDVTTNSKTDITNIQLNRPAGLAVASDSVQSTLYVSNSESLNCGPLLPCDAVLVFNNPAALTSGATPDNTITNPALQSPRGISVDAERNRLYATSHGNNAVLIFPLDDTNNPVILNSTEFDNPVGVAVDTDPDRDLLYVLNQGTKDVLVFEGASGLSGGESPSWRIADADADGNQLLSNPAAIFVDAAKDLLYIADRGANMVYIFPEAGESKGQTGNKTLAGNKTGLLSPAAITVDTASP